MRGDGTQSIKNREDEGEWRGGKGRLRVSYTDNEPLENEIPDLLKCTKQWLAREKYEATRQENSCEKYTAHKGDMRTKSRSDGDCYNGNRCSTSFEQKKAILKHINNGNYDVWHSARKLRKT